MKCGELFLKDPLSWRIHNEGVSSNNAVDEETLKYELRTFVCSGEYQTGLRRILEGYLNSLGKEQKAVWVSGFYGSGKSHLVKMLRFLWTNTPFADNSTPRSLADLPQDILDLLKELDTAGKQRAGLHSAGGTLSAGVGSVRLRLLGIVLRSASLPQNPSQAALILDLQDDGLWESFAKSIKAKGKEPRKAIGQLYTSKALHEAYLEVMPHLGEVSKVGPALRAQYPAKQDDLTVESMVAFMRRVLNKDEGLPCTVIVMDEVQQYINDNPQVAMEVQELVEACSKSLDGRVLFVGTGQSALNDTPALQKLMGRFTIKAHLRDTDVVKVVRTVVLQKQEDRRKDISKLMESHAGELARQLNGTKIATRPEDEAIYVADYPLLPVRRRLWENILHSVDPTGTQAQMRTQLSVTHEACQAIADKPLGAVVPADFIYNQLANGLVNSGELQKRFQEIVEEQKSKADGELRSRICALTFLINKLPREGVDIGVRATAEHLADLLSDNLETSPTELRKQVPELVKHLVEDGVLMEVDGEFRLQTTEGAAWEGEYGKIRRGLIQDEAVLAAERNQRLQSMLDTSLKGVSILHGKSKEKRKVKLHQSKEKPPTGDDLVIWVRDGFQESEKAILRDIQGLSTDDPTIHVFIPKSRADDLKQALASSLAAEQTMNSKGNPTTDPGKEARKAMATRQGNGVIKVKDLLGDILGGARVLLSGGQEITDVLLKDAVEKAGTQVLDRLYPKFGLADNPNWHLVFKRAKQGNGDALSAVSYKGDPDKHPISKELLKKVGAGCRGSALHNEYTSPPYGWPKDAIDAVVAVLLVSGHLSARKESKHIGIGDMSQRDVGLVDLRVQHPVLTTTQKLRIRKLFQNAGYTYSPGDETGAASGFVRFLKTLATSSGGAAPAPPAPKAPQLIELEALQGNDLTFALFNQADSLEEDIKQWKARAAAIDKRMPKWELTQRLAAHAAMLPKSEEWQTTIKAVQDNRSLLADPDPLASLVKEMATALRKGLNQASAMYDQTYQQHLDKLNTHPAWQQLGKEKQEMQLTAAGVMKVPLPDMATEEELLVSLDASNLQDWKTLAQALQSRFDSALMAAIKASEPKATRITLPPATLRSVDELEPWLEEVRPRVQTALSDGPVII